MRLAHCSVAHLARFCETAGRDLQVGHYLGKKLEDYLLLGWLPVGHDNQHDRYGCLCVWSMRMQIRGALDAW